MEARNVNEGLKVISSLGHFVIKVIGSLGSLATRNAGWREGKADRVGIKLQTDGKRVRVFKSSGEEIKVA